MKSKIKIIILLFIFACISLNSIPSLRVRTIANSNSESDVTLKDEIASYVNSYITKNNITYENIDNYLNDIENKIEEKFEVSATITKKLEYFDSRSVNEKITKAGFYNSIVIKLNEANGANYFSVLYPSYYTIKKEENTSEISYHSYVIDMLKKIFERK